ncbi:hypothetical protein [Streptomyces rimosus]|uniref:hypothetical protein n=1 Tax=Streptomyces rimosus TaxID=1927 RepID=UPI000AAD6562|nr:hypothetical protein [Streptomyces rimosus]
MKLTSRSIGVTATLVLAMAGTSLAAASAASAADGRTGSVKVCNKGAYVADFAVNNKFVGAFPVGQCKTATIDPGTTGEVDVTLSKYTGFWWTGFWRTASEGGPNWSSISYEKAPADQDTCYAVYGSTLKAWTGKTAC